MLSVWKMSWNSFLFEDAQAESRMISATRKAGVLSWKEESSSTSTGKNSEVE